jgi:hypothetical protein
MGAVVRSIDRATTPTGAAETWPQSLRKAVSIPFESRSSMALAWGPSFVQSYDDGYRPILGSTKHPAAMGSGAQATFAESWHFVGPMFEGARRWAPTTGCYRSTGTLISKGVISRFRTARFATSAARSAGGRPR